MKKKLIFIAVFFLFICLSLTGCLRSPEYQARQFIDYLSLSNDGSKLIVITSDNPGGLNPITTGQIFSDFQVWNLSSMSLILSQYPTLTRQAFFSPDGRYLIKDASIFNISSHDIVLNFTGRYHLWQTNNELFYMIEKNNSNINILLWNANNFTYNGTVILPELSDYITISSNGEYAAFISLEHVLKIIQLRPNSSIIQNIDIPKTGLKAIRDKPLFFSNFSKVGCIVDYTKYTEVLIWNVSDGKMLNNFSIIGYKIIQSPNTDHFLTYSYEKAFYIYNDTGLEKTIPINKEYTAVAWLYELDMIALGDIDGIVEIRNISTWELINTLETPLHDFYHTMPAPAISYIFIFVALTIMVKTFIKRKEKP